MTDYRPEEHVPTSGGICCAWILAAVFLLIVLLV